jgi:hypothetical protein
MAASQHGDKPERRRNGQLDDRVKIPLPFEEALRGLLATEPDENGTPEKQPAEQPAEQPRKR